MTNLRSILDAEIERDGAISFARFMEIALYTPNLGYYERAQAVGTAGDFYTSVSVGTVFGELLAFQFARWLEELDSPRLQLVEAGAHHGQLASDILGWLERHEPALFDRIEYAIVEPSKNLKERQLASLKPFNKSVQWLSHCEDFASKQTGIIFSNELLDAFPTHVLAWEKATRRWRELGVTRSGQSFIWTLLPKPLVSFENMPQLPGELLEVLPEGFRTEVTPAASDWWRKASNTLQNGRLMTIDYGLDTEEFFAPHRAQGTVRAYQKHRPGGDLLVDPGSQDITAHVDFAKVRGMGESQGLRTIDYVSQTRFLTQVVEKMTTDARIPHWTAVHLRQFQTLTHPDHLGRNFRVLVQKR